MIRVAFLLLWTLSAFCTICSSLLPGSTLDAENRGEAAPARQQGQAEGHEGCLRAHRYHVSFFVFFSVSDRASADCALICRHRRDIRGHGVAQDDGDRHGGSGERGEQAAEGVVVGDHRLRRASQGAGEERSRGEEGRREEGRGRQERRRGGQEEGRRGGEEGRRRGGQEEGRRREGQGRRRQEGGGAADGAADHGGADEPVPGVLLPVPAHDLPHTLLRAEHGGEPQLLHHLLKPCILCRFWLLPCTR